MRSILGWLLIRSRRYQLEAIALRLHGVDHIIKTTDDPVTAWDNMRPGLEKGLGLEPGSLNSEYGWSPFQWSKEGWH
jgi:hypothetical protein